MVIVYPHNQRFRLQRAHDILVMKTCHALACAGNEVYLLMGKTQGDSDDLVRYYGLEPHPNLHLVQLPILRGQGLIRFSWHGVFNFFCRKAITRLHRQVGIDVLYLTEIKLARALLADVESLDIPMVYEVHGLYAKQYKKSDEREEEVFRRSAALVTTTRSLQEVMSRIYPEMAVSYRVPLATELPAHVEKFRAPESGGGWRLGYVGQLYPLQGVDLLVEAMKLLPDNIRLEIIGGKAEHIDTLKSLVAESEVEKRIHFAGFVPPIEVARRAAAADILLAPCRDEKKMPYVAHTKLYEYLALGRPVIAADLPSVREEITPGEQGLLHAPGDAADLAAKVMELIEQPALAEAMAERGLAQAREFSWRGRAERLVEVFAGVAEGKTL